MISITEKYELLTKLPLLQGLSGKELAHIESMIGLEVNEVPTMNRPIILQNDPCSHLVFLTTGSNPYPLVFKCLVKSGLTAFFTRSSAANLPVNMALCEELKLKKETYSISIPLGCTINMSGAGITIVVMTMAAAHTLGIEVSFGAAFLMCIASVLCACGSSGVAGGSLMLIPLACSIFGIPSDVAMQVVGIGFIIGVVQDSCETALNSSTDVIFTAASCMRAEKKALQNKENA